MDERVRMIHNKTFGKKFYTLEPQSKTSDDLHLVLVEKIHLATPYELLLASLSSCTGMLLHAYSEERDISLEEVKIDAVYRHAPDHQDEQSTDEIGQTITVSGFFTREEEEKIERISTECRIHHILEKDIRIRTHWKSVKAHNPQHAG